MKGKKTEPVTPIEDAAAEAKFKVSGTLKFGDRNEDVKTLQAVLKSKKRYTGAVDGIFLKETEAAVKAHQQDSGLLVDGIAGAITLASLRIEVIRIVEPNVSLENLKKGSPEWNEAAFNILKYDAGHETVIENAAKKLISNRERYEAVTKNLVKPISGPGFIEPWKVVGAIHNMESSQNFAGILHNGQKIIGTGKKSTIVPIGVGPFATWEASAIDALTSKGFGSLDFKIGNVLAWLERFNGTGYLTGAGKAEASPYLWAKSSINDGKGKYVADGKYSATADANGQVGAATLLKEVNRLLGPKVIIPEIVYVPGHDLKKELLAYPKLEPKMVNRALPFLNLPAVLNKNYFIMINFSLNDALPRLYLVNLHTLEIKTYKVAHGKKSDPNRDGVATEFSNVLGTNQSSLGAILVGAKFTNPKWKYCRLLHGMEKDLNGNIRKREIIWHSTTYVNDVTGSPAGDTLGCIGVSEASAEYLTPLIGDALIYAWANELEG